MASGGSRLYVTGRIVRSLKQIKTMSARLSGAITKKLGFPIIDEKSFNAGKSIAKYVNSLIKETASSIGKDKAVMQTFLEATYFRGQEFGKIIKGGYLMKKAGGRYKTSKVIQAFQNTYCNCWHQRYFILSDEGIGYAPDFDNMSLTDNLFFDMTLRVMYGKSEHRENLEINIVTSSRKLRLKAESIEDMYEWLSAIVDSINNSRYCKINRFNSFCPVTRSNYAKWYINGHEYYKDLADELEKAESRIFITDWWLSPELYLKRPIPIRSDGIDTKWRLDQVLLRAANRGVMIYVLLYKEFDHALPNDSSYSRKKLMSLHKNIEVMRHPGDLIFLWSHHEKLCIVDNTVTFMGGLDLCFGRWDTEDYWLSDPGDDKTSTYFPGQDFSNVRIKDFCNVKEYDMALISRADCPRMPWRDIAICLRGQVVRDTVRHFIQYWNFAKEDLSNDLGRLGKANAKNRKETKENNLIFSGYNVENSNLGNISEKSPTNTNTVSDGLTSSSRLEKATLVMSFIIDEADSSTGNRPQSNMAETMVNNAKNTDIEIEQPQSTQSKASFSKYIKAIVAQSKEGG